MCYVAAYACIVVDYFLWGRKIRPIKFRQMTIIFVPQLLLGGLLLSIYNPLGKNVLGITSDPWLLHRVTLLLRNLRDINSCEMCVGVLIIIAPLLYTYTNDKRLLRGTVVIFIYCLAVALVSPQPLRLGYVASVRYLAPLIPLCIFTAVISIQALTERFKWLVIPMALLALGTNVLHGGPAASVYNINFAKGIAKVGFRSTIIEFIRESISPNPSPYSATAKWINENLKNRESIWVLPDYANHPLMYHAPKATYAWQLNENAGNQFKGIPDIHFIDRVLPEYIIAFGPPVNLVKQRLKE